MEYKYTGIILGKKDIGEADRFYAVYTLEKGKIQVLAKGVRKAQARLAGSLENFNLVSFTAVGKNGIKKITNAVVEDNFRSIRKNLEALENVFYSIKVFNSLVGNEEKEEKIFYFLLEYLQAMDSVSSGRADKIKLVSQGFLVKLFEHLGYKIEVSRCASCSQPINAGDHAFSAEKGGLACSGCSRQAGETINISHNAVKIIRIFYQNSLKSLSKLKVGQEELEDLQKITARFWQWIAK